LARRVLVVDHLDFLARCREAQHGATKFFPNGL
jgi:hypothetical protein